LSKQEPLSSVKNAIRILSELSLENREIGITELSHRMGLAKSTVFRLISTLSGNNLVEKNVLTQKYHLGIGAFELGFAAYHGNKLRSVAYPLLHKLMTVVREAAHLGIYDQGEVIFLCKREPDTHQGTISKIGKRVPSHCTASGKILLSNQSKQEINRVIDKGLTKYTDKTIQDSDKMITHLRDIREKGYATAISEYKEDVCSIAVPVFDDSEEMIAAISLATNKSYLYPLQIQNYVKVLKSYSRLITERLD
jgi:IclR family KDG regulon transcriptional repressor